MNKPNVIYNADYNALKQYIGRSLKDILVIYKTNEEEVNFCFMDFNTVKEVATWIETYEDAVNKVLKGKNIKGTLWRPNIFYKNIDDEYQYRYIVVYREDWFNYSDKQRENRINKLVY